MMKAIIDRFEGDYAVVEIEGCIKTIRRSYISDEAQEGDILIFENNQWIIDRKDTEKIRKEIKELADKLWE
jgi:hydrogenase maturation factor